MTNEIWYYEKDGQQLGPKSWESLRIGLRLGKLNENTRVWASHLDEWTTISLCTSPEGATNVADSDSTEKQPQLDANEGWHLNYEGVEVGPTTWEQIFAAHKGQLIDKNTYVWAPHLPEWVLIDTYLSGLNSLNVDTVTNQFSNNNANIQMITPPPTSIFDSSTVSSIPSPNSKIHKRYSKPPIFIQSASNVITNNLGLEQIQGFSIKTFFSEVFSKHDPDELERLLSIGSTDTTPSINASMSVLPNPWMFFRVLCGTIATYFLFLTAWKMYHNLNLLPGLIMVGSFAFPFSILILFFELNTPKNISLVRIVQLVVIGGALSIFLSLFLFEITPMLGEYGPPSAGIIEEVGKLLVLLIAMRTLNFEKYKYGLNGLLIGASLGAGFAAFESAGYALRAGISSENVMLDVIQLRGLMSPFSHIAWTAIAGGAFWKCKHLHDGVIGVLFDLRFLRLFIVPVVLHTIWNLPFEGPLMTKFVVLGFISWVVVLSLVQSGLDEIRSSIVQ